MTSLFFSGAHRFRLWGMGLTLLLGSVLAGQTSRPGEAAKKSVPWGAWDSGWGDQGDGTYRNPVLPADYSDLDCIRVGSDYYAISSTFQYSPGMVILHSKDLVNWTIKGHALADLRQIGPELNWDRMNRYGKGVWAGAIRHHDGRFWIYFGAPEEGYFMTSAKEITGPWEPLHPVVREAGWDDCCPFWDDDGQGYFVGTNFRDGYKIHLWKLSPDGRDLIRESDRVIHQSKGSEANKLYKINGFYYHLFSEVTKEGRAVMMERSRDIFGPYENARQLSHADKPAKEPNQGGLVQTEKGDWFWFTHHGSGDWAGRYASLLPVTWKEGWPLLGQVGADGIGSMVWSGKKPEEGTPVAVPQSSDEFESSVLPPQWEWNYQPRAEKWSLTERPGWLRLAAFKPLVSNDLLKAGNTLTQRVFRTGANEVTIKLDLSGMADGQKAGLCHFSVPNYSALGVVQNGSVRTLEIMVKGKVVPVVVLTDKSLWLRSTWGLDGQSHYAYSPDGKVFVECGEPYQLQWGSYRGDRLGLYSFNSKADDGHVDVDFFHYDFSGPQSRKR